MTASSVSVVRSATVTPFCVRSTAQTPVDGRASAPAWRAPRAGREFEVEGRVRQPDRDEAVVRGPAQQREVHADLGPAGAGRVAAADEGDAAAVAVGPAREQVAGQRVGRRRGHLLAVALDALEAKPAQQLVGGRVRELERLVQRCAAAGRRVVRLERVDRVQAQLRTAARVRAHPVLARDARPERRVVGIEADRVAVGLGVDDPEASGQAQHRHGATRCTNAAPSGAAFTECQRRAASRPPAAVTPLSQRTVMVTGLVRPRTLPFLSRARPVIW
jgi:hypothetical protein